MGKSIFDRNAKFLHENHAEPHEATAAKQITVCGFYAD